MLKRYRTYNGSNKYKIRNPYYNGKGTFVYGVSLELSEDVSAHRNVTCFDGNDGSITVIASGGVAPYVYSMDSTFATSQSSPTFDNLFITGPVTESTDEYGGILICTKTIYVKDANDMISSVNVQLQSPVEMQWVGGPTEEVVVYCDEGEDYATIIPGVTYPIPTLTQTATITGSIVQPEGPWTQQIGQNDCSYIVKDSCVPGKKRTIYTFSITVLPNPNNE